jgi:hypothetical protein
MEISEGTDMHALIYKEPGARSMMICDAMREGIEAMGDTTSTVFGYQHDGRASADVAVFYGLKDGKRTIFNDYVKAGKHALFIDLGYWGRREKGKARQAEFHRFTVDKRHPFDKVMINPCPSDRIDRHVPRLEPRRHGDFIILAGMSRKSAHSYDMGWLQWENHALQSIRKYTERPVVYRPKPEHRGTEGLDGTRYSPREERLEGLLAGAHCVVTHHSNVSCEAVVAGVPAIIDSGIGWPVCGHDISDIETPFFPDDGLRRQWLNNVGYWQWNCMEMAKGEPWFWFKHNGFFA